MTRKVQLRAWGIRCYALSYVIIPKRLLVCWSERKQLGFKLFLSSITLYIVHYTFTHTINTVSIQSLCSISLLYLLNSFNILTKVCFNRFGTSLELVSNRFSCYSHNSVRKKIKQALNQHVRVTSFGQLLAKFGNLYGCADH